VSQAGQVCQSCAKVSTNTSHTRLLTRRLPAQRVKRKVNEKAREIRGSVDVRRAVNFLMLQCNNPLKAKADIFHRSPFTRGPRRLSTIGLTYCPANRFRDCPAKRAFALHRGLSRSLFLRQLTTQRSKRLSAGLHVARTTRHDGASVRRAQGL